MLQHTFNTIKDFFIKNTHGFLAVVYPSICLLCSKELPEKTNFLCHSCIDNLHFTHFEKYDKDHPAAEVFWGRCELKQVYSMLYFQKGNSTKQLMHTVKYKDGKELAVFLGEMMGEKICGKEQYNTIEALVPIPLHGKKAFIRGYNQSLKISEGLAEKLNIPITELIIRKKHHQSQTKKNRFERWDNVADIFDVNSDISCKHKHIALVDDVLTTGSTLESAYRTLKEAHPELAISVLTIALAKG